MAERAWSAERPLRRYYLFGSVVQQRPDGTVGNGRRTDATTEMSERRKAGLCSQGRSRLSGCQPPLVGCGEEFNIGWFGWGLLGWCGLWRGWVCAWGCVRSWYWFLHIGPARAVGGKRSA